MLNLGDYFVTTQGGFCPQRIDEYRKHFDKVFVFCLGNKGKQEMRNNVTVYSGPLLRWYSFFRKIEKNNVAFVKIQDLFVGGWLGVRFSRKLKVPLVLRCGGEWNYKPNSLVNFIKAIISYFTKRKVLSTASKIVFNSKYISKKVLDGKKVNVSHEIVYNGVNTQLFNPAESKQTNKPLNLLYVGRVRKDKGLSYLMSAMSITKKWNLTIIGSGNYLSVISDKNLPNVKLLGKVAHKDIPGHLASADAFILPSLPESSESFPSSVLEAMASGLPVIASRIAGIPEMIADGTEGILISPHSSEHIINALKALEDDETRAELGEAARKKVMLSFRKDTQLPVLSKKLFGLETKK